MKSLSFVFVCLFGLSAFAQQRPHAGDIQTMAQQVDTLVQQSIYSLPVEHQRYVRESLRGIIQSFAMNGVNANVGGGWQNPPPPPYPPVQSRNLICDTNGNILVDLTGGTSSIVHDFGSADDCNKAKRFVAQGQPYCDFAGGNILFRASGGIIHDFGSAQDCEAARESVSYGRGFCDLAGGNILYSADGRIVYDFSSAADCQAALRDQR